MNCPVCAESDIIRYGHQENGVQKYHCNSCGKIFNGKVGTPLYHLHKDEKTVKIMINLFLNGVPMSVISESLEITEQCVRDILSKVIIHFEKYEQFKINYNDYSPEVLEVDEIYIKIQGKKYFYSWIAYDPVNKVIIDFEIGSRDKSSLEKMFKRLKKFRTKIKLVLVDGYQGYENIINKYLGKKRFKPLVGVLNKSHFSKENYSFLTYGLFGKSKKKVINLVKKYGIGNTISTALIERLNREFRDSSPYLKRRSPNIARAIFWVEQTFKAIKFYHNVCKPHWKLSFRTSKNWIKNPITPLMKVKVVQEYLSIEKIIKTPTLC